MIGARNGRWADGHSLTDGSRVECYSLWAQHWYSLSALLHGRGGDNLRRNEAISPPPLCAGAIGHRQKFDLLSEEDAAMARLIHNQKQLTDWVKDESGPLDIAVAFWGTGAVKELGLDLPGRKIRVLLDLSSGATNPDAVRQLLKYFPNKVRAVNRLHAKAFIGMSKIAVGSANASANGLGIEGAEARQWHELALTTSDPTAVQQAHAWFTKKWSHAEAIDVRSDRFKEAEQAWKENRKSRPLPDAGNDCLITAAIKNPGAYTERGWYVVVDLENLSKEGLAAVEREEAEQGRPAFAWENADIPPQAYLVSITRFDGKHFRLGTDNGAPEPVFFTGDIKRKRLKFVTPSHIPGFIRNVGTIGDWLPSVKKAEAEYPEWKHKHGLCLDLGEFAKTYGVLKR